MFANDGQKLQLFAASISALGALATLWTFVATRLQPEHQRRLTFCAALVGVVFPALALGFGHSSLPPWAHWVLILMTALAGGVAGRLFFPLKPPPDAVAQSEGPLAPIIHGTPAEYNAAIAERLKSLSHDVALYASVGTADFVHTWLLREIQSWLDAGIPPKISSITILRLSPRLVTAATTAGLLDSNFQIELDRNLAQLRSNPLMSGADISLRVKELDAFPLHHGFAFAEHIFHGRWQIDHSGHLHVRTPLQEQSPNDRTQAVEEIRKWFKTAGALEAAPTPRSASSSLLKELTSGSWELQYEPSNTRARKVITFAPNGEIGIGQNLNEKTWRLDGEVLTIWRNGGSLQNRFIYDADAREFHWTETPDAKGLRLQVIRRS